MYLLLLDFKELALNRSKNGFSAKINDNSLFIQDSKVLTSL